MQKRSCFCGFWKRKVHSSAWQSGFRAAGCQFAGQLRHMEYTVRTLSCRNSFEDRDRGIFLPLFCGVGFCDLLWVYLEKNTDRTDAPNGAATRRSRLRRAAPAAATERCFLPLSKATTKRLRQQPAVRRERLVAAAGESRRLKPGASPKDWRRRLRLCSQCSFSKYAQS